MAKKKTRATTRRAPKAAAGPAVDGQRLAGRRLERGYTARKFAEALDVPASWLSAVENDHKEIRSDLLKRICLLLDCSADWLLGISESPERRK